MNQLVIQINWEYFLGIVGSIVALAWYSSAKFSRIETSMEWMRNSLGELKNDIQELRTDVGNLKTDLAIMRMDLNEVRSDVDSLMKNQNRL